MTAQATSIDPFGKALRQERQRRSVSLEDISQTTKVTVRNLEALETEHFEQLPGGILSKGIVRGYVRCLGLDEGEWVKRFLDASQPAGAAQQPAANEWASFALNVSHGRVREEKDMKLRWAGVVALLLLLAGFGWMVWGYVHQRVAALQPPHAAPLAAEVLPASHSRSHARSTAIR